MSKPVIDVTGRLHKVLDERTIGSGRLVEIVVMETEDVKYLNYWIVQLWNDKIEFIDRFKLGDKVCCHCHLNGKKYDGGDETRYFLSLYCFGIGDPDNPTSKPKKKVEKEGVVGDGITFPEDDTPAHFNRDGINLSDDSDDEKDDLPF